VLVGLSHRSAPLPVRERCTVAPASLPERLVELRGIAGATELLILSTCNRTEMLAVGSDGIALEERLRASFPEDARGLLYAHQGAECVLHVFSVCSGLRSMVLGEAEIQAQLKAAWRAAHDAGAGGTVIDAVIQQALRTAKRVRTETELGTGTVSVAGAAVELIGKVHGDLSSCDVLVIGAGETGQLLAKNLQARGVRRLAFANRTGARAEQAAVAVAGSVVPFERIVPAAAEHDIVVTCVDAPEPLLRARDLAAVRWPRRDLPKVFVDLSVPRAIETAVNGLNGAFLFDVDALQTVVLKNLDGRHAEASRAERIVVEEARKFLALRVYAALSPSVSELADRFEKARRAWADAHRKDVPADLDTASEELARHLLAIALSQMKAGARMTQSEAAIERTWRRYRERHE
jgi:glutamyl-tRNA reductase